MDNKYIQYFEVVYEEDPEEDLSGFTRIISMY